MTLCKVIDRLAILAICGLIGPVVPIASAEPPSATQPSENGPTRVLMFVGGEYHDYDALPAELAQRLGSIPAKSIRISRDLNELTKYPPDSYDVLVFNTCIKEGLDGPQQSAILAGLRAGKGLIALHCSLYSFQNWPEWRQILGGLVQGHDPYGEFELRVVDTGHPITAGVPETFRITDEPYILDEFDPANHVLLRTLHPLGKHSTPEPMAWTRRHGPARVAAIMLGHDRASQSHPAFARLLEQAIQWAAGRTPPPVMLSEEERFQGFTPLFNGKDLAGWKYDPRHWTVRDGIIIGNSHPAGLEANSFAISEQSYGDFVLRFSVQFISGNTGVQFRSAAGPGFEVAGYQTDIVLPAGWGNLHEQNGRRRLIDGWTGKGEHAYSSGWNYMEVFARGDRIILKTNGVVTAEWTEPQPDTPRAGIIALQLHRGDPMEVRFTNLRIKPLDEHDPPAGPSDPSP